MADIIQNVIKNTRELKPENKGSGVATELGEILAQTAGLAVPADSGTVKADLLGLCKQDVTVADAETRVLVLRPFDGDTFIFPVTNTSDPTHNGQAMVLTNSREVNNTGSTSGSGIVQQVEVFGPTGDKLIIGRFLTL